MYRIVNVDLWEQADVVAPGQRPKEWLISPETRQYVLFKRHSYHVSELASEKVAAEIGLVIGIPTARTEFAMRHGQMGIISYRFSSVEEALVHGGDLLVGARRDYDRTRPREQTFQLIRQVLPPDLLPSMIELIAFDALIGNTDRHHDNWAIIRARTAADRLAPAYDHGSCLGSHVEDDRIAVLNRDAYIRRGRSAVRWLEEAAVLHLPHIELLRRIVREHENEVRIAVNTILEPPLGNLVAKIGELPDEYAGEQRRLFTADVLRRRIELLSEVFHG